jgi:two-component sensor histidine kinase
MYLTYTGQIILFVLLLVIAAAIYSGYRRIMSSVLHLRIVQEDISLQNRLLGNLNHQQKILLREKELLLREAYHRVKNNLQTTINLLDMQAAYISNEEALKIIQNSKRRIYAMSLITQKLYDSDVSATVNMKDYIADLVSYLKESLGADYISIEVRTQQIELDDAQATPIGLIVSEAITNAVKHAFPTKLSCKIVVSFEEYPKHNYILTITDNGRGLPQSFDSNSDTNSMGMSLMKGLADQLDGEFRIWNITGTCLTVVFQDFNFASDEFAESMKIYN